MAFTMSTSRVSLGFSHLQYSSSLIIIVCCMPISSPK